MQLTIEKTPEQIEVVKCLASRDRVKVETALAAIGTFFGGLVSEVINTAPTISNLFTPMPFNEDDDPVIPVDLFFDLTAEDSIRVWSMTSPDNLATNRILTGQQEMRFDTYTLDSAISFHRKRVRRGRLDVVAAAMNRVMQEVLYKQETAAATALLTALAEAQTNSRRHVQRAAQAGRILPHDLNQWMTLSKRIVTSWTKGTPDFNRGRGITDVLLSPEVAETLREIPYNPISTRDADGTAASAADGHAAPDSIRAEFFGTGGIPSLYGLSFMEINELGQGERFNSIFDVAAGSTSYTDAAGSNGAVFNGSTTEIVIGIDRSRTNALVRPYIVDEETGDQFTLQADDFHVREKKVGWYGSLDEGRAVLDNRALVGLIV